MTDLGAWKRISPFCLQITMVKVTSWLKQPVELTEISPT